MASGKEYLEFVRDQLSLLDGISFKAMMGEYILYCRGKIVGGIYDDRLLIKPTKSARKMMPDAPYELPYEGAKPMLLAEELDDKLFLKELIEAVVNELPTPKEKRKTVQHKSQDNGFISAYDRTKE